MKRLIIFLTILTSNLYSNILFVDLEGLRQTNTAKTITEKINKLRITGKQTTLIATLGCKLCCGHLVDEFKRLAIEICKKRNCKILMGKTIYVDPSLDITQEVIKQFNLLN